MPAKGQVQDLSGMRFGRLLALRHVGTNEHRQTIWLFRCDCGTVKGIAAGNVKTGSTVSCGCYIRSKTSERSLIHGGKAGGRETPEYKSWQSMKRRCGDPGSDDYINYGGRGITVCARWRDSFAAFLADMGPRPSRLYSIDRKNNDGNYEPGNCGWATAEQQAGNRRNTIRVTLGGVEMSLSAAARQNGINRITAQARVRRGWDPLRAATAPVDGGGV